jgi:hypothetical protein
VLTPTTGVITVDDQIYDAYLVANSAAVTRVTMLHNITLVDFSITTEAPFLTGTSGFTSFRFVDDLQIERVEAHHAYVARSHCYRCLTPRPRIAKSIYSQPATAG